MSNNLVRESIAELIGTFVLVFIGGFAVVVAPLFGVIVPALAHGLILVGLIYTYGHISGTQINPAVTVGLLVGGKIDPVKAGAFIIAQFVGGIIAAAVIVAVMPDGAQIALLGSTEAFNYGQTTGALTDNYVWSAVIIEAILTFLLVSAVYQTAAFGKGGNMAGIAIGFTLAGCILAGGALTGASLNPARTLGPALMAGNLDYVIPYFIGLFAGGAAAGAFHTFVLNTEK
ncbi:MAG: aquaporin [Aggregatilineales bacterium]